MRTLGFFAALSLVLSNLLAEPAKAADSSTYGYDVQRTGNNPHETGLGVNNIGNLHELWTFNLGGATISQPVYASGVDIGGKSTDVIYAGSENGNFYALNAATGKLIWSQNLGVQHNSCQDLPNGSFGVSSTATLDRTTNMVYAVGGQGKAYALDMSTGAIKSGWPVSLVDPSVLHVYGAVNLFGGKLYAAAASYCDLNTYYGQVVEVDLATAKVVNHFYTTGSTGPGGGGIWGPGGVSIDPNSNNVYAATGNALGSSESLGYAERVVRLKTSLSVVSSNYPGLTGSDVDFGATPLLFNASTCAKSLLAAENKTGTLFLYDRYNINLGPLQTLSIAHSSADGQFVGIPAFSPATNMVYVSNPTDSNDGTYQHGMVALKVQSDCTLTLAWQTQVGSMIGQGNAAFSPPTIANGVVYMGDGLGQQVFAFDAKTGKQLWASSTITGSIFAAPLVFNSKLYVGAWDNKLHAFGL
jgi:outer membrane protein assembly factor BamB